MLLKQSVPDMTQHATHLSVFLHIKVKLCSCLDGWGNAKVICIYVYDLFRVLQA